MTAVSCKRSCLQDLLKDRSRSQPHHRAIFFYSLGNTSTPTELSYSDLYIQAKKNVCIIRSLVEFREGHPILIHYNNHYDTILWFWSVLLAKGLPVISTPFSNIDQYRQSHLQHLSSLLESPICITSNDLLSEFDGTHTLAIYTKETLVRSNPQAHNGEIAGTNGNVDDDEGLINGRGGGSYAEIDGTTTAFLMLTSGSTGNAKAVCLSHRQVLASVKGKASARPMPQGRPLLNWTGLDHVASLVEIHILALWEDVGQIHVHAADMTASPMLFLDLLSRHHVARSFAPNFFLAKLVSAIENSDHHEDKWDLSGLSMINSGGEANNVQTCAAVSRLLEMHGAPRNVIVPGFGMTETCAGAIFNLSCPEYDVGNSYEVSSLGRCVEGIEMRVTVATPEGGSIIAVPDEIGNLELRGDVVFERYYRDPVATAGAFTSNHWFITGDQACIDGNGHLRLTGRTTDVTNLNGVKIPSSEIQSAIEQALGQTVARVLSFPSKGPDSEQIIVTYIPNQWPIPTEELVETDRVVKQACVMCSGHLPLVFALSQESVSLLPTSTLGKVSRSRMRSLFEMGVFQRDVDLHAKAVHLYKKSRQKTGVPSDEFSVGLAKDFADTLGLDSATFDTEASLFELGCTSMDLIKLRYRIESRLSLAMPVIMLMKHPTVQSLSLALRPSSSQDNNSSIQIEKDDYDPVIVMSSAGTKAPLWLIHPGVGEVLVFVGLAQHLKEDSRPIYALRARGFEPNQERFRSIDETVQTYVKAIRGRQPRGPYAIAGYSYGAMLAFEVAKRLESEDGGGSVRFLGSFNLPPHIKSRMRHLNWNMCLLHLAYFLGLITEESADRCEDAGFRAIISRDEVINLVLEMADRSRMEELQLGKPELTRWADVAFGLQVSTMHLFTTCNHS